jgi:hypothetical protein
MGLFNSAKGATDFWKRSPITNRDAEALHRHGIDCVRRQDGEGMIAAGWALFDGYGINERQALDFLRDGFRAWSASPQYDAQAARSRLGATRARHRTAGRAPAV